MTPPFDRMQLAVAGHPLPVVAPPDQDPFFANVDADQLLGLGDDVPRHSTEVALPPGSTVAFYTDGLIERRDEPLDIGLERLRTRCFAAPPRPVLHNIMRQLIGNTEPQDDVALLVFHTRDDHDRTAAGPMT